MVCEYQLITQVCFPISIVFQLKDRSQRWQMKFKFKQIVICAKIIHCNQFVICPQLLHAGCDFCRLALFYDPFCSIKRAATIRHSEQSGLFPRPMQVFRQTLSSPLAIHKVDWLDSRSSNNPRFFQALYHTVISQSYWLVIGHQLILVEKLYP